MFEASRISSWVTSKRSCARSSRFNYKADTKWLATTWVLSRHDSAYRSRGIAFEDDSPLVCRVFASEFVLITQHMFFRSGRTCFWAMWRACRKMCSCVAWSQLSFRGNLCDCIPPTRLWLWVRPCPGWSRSSWWSTTCQSYFSHGCTVFAHWCRGHGARWA